MLGFLVLIVVVLTGLKIAFAETFSRGSWCGLSLGCGYRG